MKLHVIAARQRLPPSILRRRARYAMASSRSGRAPPAAIPQGRGASLLARFPSTSARHPAGRATHPAPVLRLRPPPSRRGAPRPHLPDFRLRPPASPQGALHILRQFSACARRRPAGARAVHHSPDFHLRPPPFRRGAVRPYLPDFRLHPPAIPQGARAVRHSPDFRLRPPPARRGAVRPYLPDFRLHPPAIPQGRARYVIHRISACARRQPAGAHCAQSRRMDSGIPTGNNAADGMDRPRWNWRAAALHTSRYPRIRRDMPQRRSLPAHLPLRQPSAHPGSSSLPRASRSGGAAAVRCPCAF